MGDQAEGLRPRRFSVARPAHGIVRREPLETHGGPKETIGGTAKQADGKLNALLRSEQKKQLKRMQDMARGICRRRSPTFSAGPPGGAPGGPRGGAPGGFPGFGGGVSGARRERTVPAPRYSAEYAGLVGKDLTPGKTIEEMEAASRPTPSAAPKDK